jgi:CRISPR-associated protein Cas6
MPVTPVIDIRWRITARGSIPIHHQYLLLAAVSRIVPQVHGSGEFGLHPIRGIRTTPGRLDLLPSSSLTIRTRASNISTLLPLSGMRLKLAESSIKLGIPRLIALAPCPELYSSLVTIKGFMEENAFDAAIRRQLNVLGISRIVAVQIGTRKVLRIKNQAIIGFTVRLDHLEDNESLSIQESGLGGRRHLGCGLFNPSREAERPEGGK